MSTNINFILDYFSVDTFVLELPDFNRIYWY